MLDRITQGDPQNPLFHFGIDCRMPPITVKEFTYEKGESIYRQNAAAEYMYQVKTGAVRTYKLLSDGRRQIGAFHLAGDIFGLETEQHRFTAEAIIETRVLLVRRSRLADYSLQDPAVAGRLLSMTTANLRHVEDRLLLLGRKSSVEKVAAFLVEMDKRLAAHKVLALPMSRRDIADYLGLTLETVSRALAKLHRAGVLKFIGNTQREIAIVDRQGLASFDF